MSRARISLGLTPVLAMVLTAACGSAPAQEDEQAQATASQPELMLAGEVDGLAPDVIRRIAEVQKATARFQNLEAAKAAGYTAQQPEGCMESPDGAQGFHYLNTSLVDDRVELLTPELLMYERQEDGTMQLIGVDYIIPFDQWKRDEAPTLIGQKLGRNEKLGVWALHIWTGRANPNGMFAPWNPTVSCAA